MNLSERVLPSLASLSPKLQQAALYVVEHPEEIATRSLRQVARTNEMSAPTFSRLAPALGFRDYDALRRACLSHLKVQEESFAAKARALQSTSRHDDAGGAFIVHQAGATIANINQLVNSVDSAQVEAAATALARARKVILVGMMGSRPIVEHAAYVASMAFNSWQVYGNTMGTDAAMLNETGEEDVALAIAMAPYASRAIGAARNLKRAGAHVIGITDRPSSPLCQCTDSVFLVSTETPQFFTSQAATLVLLETLIGLVVRMSGQRVSERIARIEDQCHRMGDYHQSAT